MKALPLALAITAFFALTPANAESSGGSGPWMPLRSPPTPQQLGGHFGNFHGGFDRGFDGGHHGFNNGVFFPGYYVETEVIHDVVVVHDQPAEPVAPPAPPPPRKPWVMGKSYSSLPSGCMKMIEDGVSYFHCSGEWYRQVGNGQYRAVSAPL